MEDDPFLSPEDFTILCNVVEALFRITFEDIPLASGWHPTSGFRNSDVGRYLQFNRWYFIPTVQEVDNGHLEDDQTASCESDEGSLPGIDDDFDNETLQSVPQTGIDTSIEIDHVSDAEQYKLEYSIALSPSYRVPVLYLAFRHIKRPMSNVPGPPVTRSVVQLDELLSILGVEEPSAGLSLVDCPTNPLCYGRYLCWMVHPCMTADALQDLLGMNEYTNNDAAEPSNYDLAELAKFGDLAKVKYLARYFAVWIGLVGKYFRLSLPLAVARAIDQLQRLPEPWDASCMEKQSCSMS